MSSSVVLAKSPDEEVRSMADIFTDDGGYAKEFGVIAKSWRPTVCSAPSWSFVMKDP